MSDKTIFDFVCCFIPEHKEFWDSLTEKESIFFNWFTYKRDVLEAVVFKPEENPEAVEKFRNKFNELEMIVNHPECAYDNLLFNEIKTYTYKSKDSFNEYYDFIFEDPEKYSVQIKENKSISTYLKKILDLIPSIYSNKDEEYKSIFGHFIPRFDSVIFESAFESIVFSRKDMKLIPYFIEYRNENFINWIFKNESKTLYKTLLEKMQKSLAETFRNDTLQCSNQDMRLIFQEEVTSKISEILCNYGITYKNGWSAPELVYKENYFQIMFDDPNSSFSMEYTYKLSTDDIFTSIKNFEIFVKGQVENKGR